LRKNPSVRTAEFEGAVGHALDLEPLLVDGAVMPAAEQGEIGQRRGPTLRPVADVMALSDTHAAPREGASAIPALEGAPQRRRDRPGTRPDLDQAAIGVVLHDHAAGVAGQALGRSRGNAGAAFDDRLPGLLGVGEHGGVDVDDDLVALSRGARVEPVVER
jgi:hypothetical protein